MIPYILYASLILTACFIFYKVLLQNETFFRLNRFVLLTCMVLAFIVPTLRVPQQLSLRKVPASLNIIVPETANDNTGNTAKANDNIQATANTRVSKGQTVNFVQLMQWLVYLYWFGVAIFGLNFLMQAILLLYKAYSRPSIKDGQFRIVEINGDKAPCSFGNNIYINPAKYEWETYNQILLHEKIHIEQKHTLDLLLAEIVLVFQWFNPFAWLWRKELENNLEYFTDDKLLEHEAVEKASYQLSLVKVAAPHFPLSLTTNYNQSLLKKRLLMMNAKKSNVHTIWKYFFLLPMMVLFVCLFNEPVAISQPNPKSKNMASKRVHNDHHITKDGNWFATIKGDKINIQFKNDNDKSSDDNYSGGNTFSRAEFKDLPVDKQGSFSLTREAGTMEFNGKFEGDKGMGRYKFVENTVYTDNMNKDGIDLSGDDDKIVFFIVDIKRSYVQMLKQNGYTNLDKDNLIPLAALDVNEAYIKSIKLAGFTNIGLDNLVPFRALGVDKSYIDEIRQAGYKDVTPDKIITFKAQGIDGKYIADFRSSVKGTVTVDDNEDVKGNENENHDMAAKVNKNANNNKKQEHNNNQDKAKEHGDEDDIIAFKAMNIDKTFINSFKEVGYNNLSNSDLISMKALGVTPAYAKSFTAAGFTNLKADDLVAMKAQDITPSLVSQYKGLGFDDVSIQDVISAKATGTSPSFISLMREKGHKMKSLDKYIALKAVLGE